MTQRTWLITGASRGFGVEIAKAVLAAGDRLIATARNHTDLQQFGTTKDVLTLSMDVTDEAQVKAAIATGLEKFEQIDPTPAVTSGHGYASGNSREERLRRARDCKMADAI